MKIKEEHRVLVAFVLSLLIVWGFSHVAQKKTPPADRTQQTQPAIIPTPRTERTNAETTVQPISAVSTGEKNPSLPAYYGEVKRLENRLLFVDLDTMGQIKEAGLKQHIRPGETSFTIVRDTNTLADAVVSLPSWQDSLSAAAVTTETSFAVARTPETGVTVSKKMSLLPDSHTIMMTVEIVNKGKKPVILPEYRLYGGVLNVGKEMSEKTADSRILVGTGETGMVKKPIRKAISRELFTPCSWISWTSHYRLVVLRTEDTTAKGFLDNDGETVSFGLLYPNVRIEPGSSSRFTVSLYAGPSDYFVARKELAAEVFENGPFVTVGRWIFMGLEAIHRIIPNWGWCIILLTIIVKVLFYPLTRNSLVSMKKMQDLRPYMKDIQEKYKDNPQQMQKELMSLYKDYKINPLGGCIPMLVQLPIFVGFFLALRDAIFLRGAPFLLWMKDLSEPDRFLIVSGFAINLLPLIMTGTSYWQQKITPQQDPSQKMMIYIMPLMFLFLFYNFSSGLLLYWVTMNMASLGEQYAIRKVPMK